MDKEILFQVDTALGVSIRTTKNYWKKICKKHPRISELDEEIKGTLVRPEQIRKSKRDQRVHLYYRPYDKYYIAVVVKHENGEGFIITAYITDTIKEGEKVWEK